MYVQVILCAQVLCKNINFALRANIDDNSQYAHVHVAHVYIINFIRSNEIIVTKINILLCFIIGANLSESHVGIKLMFDKNFVIKSCTLQDELHAVWPDMVANIVVYATYTIHW